MKSAYNVVSVSFLFEMYLCTIYVVWLRAWFWYLYRAGWSELKFVGIVLLALLLQHRLQCRILRGIRIGELVLSVLPSSLKHDWGNGNVAGVLPGTFTRLMRCYCLTPILSTSEPSHMLSGSWVWTARSMRPFLFIKWDRCSCMIFTR